MSGGFDMDDLLRQAMAMQQQLADAQQEAATTEVHGSAGGGAVKVTMTGAGEVTQVRIDPSVVDPADVEMLEDLIVAAIHDAAHRVADLQAGALGGLAALGDLTGFDLGGLAGLGGAGPGAGPTAIDTDERRDDPER